MAAVEFQTLVIRELADVSRGDMSFSERVECSRRIVDASAAAVIAEQKRIIALVRRYLQFNDQRAVSWHEVEDCIKAIRKGE